MEGLRIIKSCDKWLIELKIVRCRWAIGRLLFLVLIVAAWVFLAIFFGIAADESAERAPSLLFCVLFFGMSLLTAGACIAAFGVETVIVTREDLVFSKEVLFFTWKKRINRRDVIAITLGHLATPGDNVMSIETVSIIYSGKRKGSRLSLILGYLIDKNYRKELYRILCESTEHVF